MFLGLHRKLTKPWDKGLALFTEATGALLPDWRHRVPSPSGLRSPGRKVNAESLYGPRDEPEEEREGEREKEWHGVTKLQWARPITLFSKGTFIPWLVHRGKWKMQGMQNQPKHSSSFALIKTQDFFLQTFPINTVVYIIFWPWRPVNILWPSFDKGCSTRKLIFPWNVFSLYF